MHQTNRKAVFAWIDACNRKPKAELLHHMNTKRRGCLSVWRGPPTGFWADLYSVHDKNCRRYPI